MGKYIIYDIETFPNLFSIDFRDPETGEHRIYRLTWFENQLGDLWDFLIYLRKNNCSMVGFNNLGFDYPVVHYAMNNKDNVTCLDIYNKAMQIINTGWNQRFSHVIWDQDQLVPQVDLFKIHHFDNMARMTSLKVLEFNMRMDVIQELPYPVGSILRSHEIEEVIKYGGRDTEATVNFFKESASLIAFREELSVKYKKNMMNFNDTKIGKDYFITKLEEAVKGSCYDYSNGKRELRQTKREVIHFDDVLVPYLQFNDPELVRIHDWFKTNTISGTETKDAFKLQCTVRGFTFKFGTGGIHGSVGSRIVTSDDYYIIEDWDVASYYPNIAIANRFYPEHLGDLFCDIYTEVYNLRKKYPKGSPENKMLKLALNGVYGDSNSKYSPFYDPQYTMAITINGQLMLCMLAEQLMGGAVELLQINTDGLTVRYPRELQGWVHNVCKWWEQVTKLELENVEYKRMFIRDVNNYIGEYTDGEVKRKGAYEYDLGWEKNHSALVTRKAAEANLLHGTDVREFIENHTNIHDFLLRTKVPKSSSLVTVDYNGCETLVQNVSRYHISSIGEDLVKIMPPTAGQLAKDSSAPNRRMDINAGWKVTVCNDIRNADLDNIDFEWYIDEANKLVRPLRKGRR